MQQPLTRLRKELAKSNIELKNKNELITFTQDFNIQFTFNGFSEVVDYKKHLRLFYDQFKIDLDQELHFKSDLFYTLELLEAIHVLLVEGQKLDCLLSLSDYKFEFSSKFTEDVRLEADIRYRYGKK